MLEVRLLLRRFERGSTCDKALELLTGGCEIHFRGIRFDTTTRRLEVPIRRVLKRRFIWCLARRDRQELQPALLRFDNVVRWVVRDSTTDETAVVTSLFGVWIEGNRVLLSSAEEVNGHGAPLWELEVEAEPCTVTVIDIEEGLPTEGA